MKVAVVTPTIGTKFLGQCIESVQNQTYENLTHYIFLDGKEHEKHIWYQLEDASKIKTVRLEENVGKGWYGHRVYAACSFLVNADVICYLDEDNWYEPDHVENMVRELNKGNEWAFSLRNIVDPNGTFLFQDNCESLGLWPVFTNPNLYHVDTSCYAVRRDVAAKIGHAWYDADNKSSADRTFFYHLKHYFPKYSCTRSYSLNYRLGGNQGVTKQFFETGNKLYEKKYDGKFPWSEDGISEIEIINTTENLT